jgi:hypothetical protein
MFGIGKPQRPQLPPTTSGPVHAVTCCHCGKTNDLRPLQEQQVLDTGNAIECDHCHHIFEVANIRPVLVVTVRRPSRQPTNVLAPAGGGGRGLPARQATTISPAQARRLLRGG